jgi:hypothetical protein
MTRVSRRTAMSCAMAGRSLSGRCPRVPRIKGQRPQDLRWRRPGEAQHSQGEIHKELVKPCVRRTCREIGKDVLPCL